jgi:hypothetical protein
VFGSKRKLFWCFGKQSICFLTVYPPAVPCGITCWQQKSGSELFPNVQTQPPTVCGAEQTEDELLKLAIEESLKSHEAEKKRFTDLIEANHMERQCLKRK